MRLVLASNSDVARANELVLTSTRETIPLDTPSAQQSGLKLKHAFEVTANTEVDLVLDFDACRSIVKAGNSGKFNLKPVIAALPILTGSISGAVDPSAARGNASVSLQRSDAATGAVSVIRATAVRADGTWTLSPVPVTTPETPGYTWSSDRGARTAHEGGGRADHGAPTAAGSRRSFRTSTRKSRRSNVSSTCPGQRTMSSSRWRSRTPMQSLGTMNCRSRRASPG